MDRIRNLDPLHEPLLKQSSSDRRSLQPSTSRESIVGRRARELQSDAITREVCVSSAAPYGLYSRIRSLLGKRFNSEDSDRLHYGPKFAEISSDEVNTEFFDPDSTESILQRLHFNIDGKVERGVRFCASKTLPTNPERPVNMLFYAKRRGGGWNAEFRDARGAGNPDYIAADYSPETARHVVKIMSDFLPKIKESRILV